ncbi:MAG: hypothetical protein JNK58_12905 [Phycisphaerae bacterium]|nr:hypothetical protein [Phycisphaerae bacterium]
MRVYLDGRLIDESGSTLDRAIHVARSHAGNRMLVQALADGKPVPAADLDHPPPNCPYASELAFASADPSGLLADVLDDAASLLIEVKERQKAAAELLQSGKIDEAVAGIGEILETWRTVKESIVLALRAGPAGGYHDRGEQELSPTIEGLASALGEIKRAMSEQDWASLSDCLAYDMQDHAERCRSWLTRARST